MQTGLKISMRLMMLALSAGLSWAAAGCGHPALDVQTAPALVPPAPDGPPAAAGATAAANWSPTVSGVPGVPFFTKRGACVRESVWLEPQYTLTMELTVDDRQTIFHTLTFPRSVYLKPDVQHLLVSVKDLSGTYRASDPHGCPAQIGTDWDPIASSILHDAGYQVVQNIDGTNQIAGQEIAGNLFRASNTAKMKSVVDYSHQYYLNGRTPWIGSSQVDAKLAGDGTLGEGSGQAEDDTWSTILSTVSSLVGSFTGTGATAAATTTTPTTPTGGSTGAASPAFLPGAVLPPPPPSCANDLPGWPAPAKTVTYKVTLTTAVYSHDHIEQDFDAVNACLPETAGVLQGSYTVTPVDSGAGKKANGNAIEVSGEIQLPAAKGGSGGKNK